MTTTLRAVRNTALLVPLAWPLAVLSGPVAHFYPLAFLGVGFVLVYAILWRWFR